MSDSVYDSKNVDVEFIIESILEGKTYREIAQELRISLAKLHGITSLSEHSARVREALKISADSYSDKAEQILKDAKGNLVEIQRARELAQHYRWKASKRDPKRFSDKLDVTTDGEKINQSIDLSKLSTEVLEALKNAGQKPE